MLAPWLLAALGGALVFAAPDTAEAQRRRPRRTNPSRPGRGRPARTPPPEPVYTPPPESTPAPVVAEPTPPPPPPAPVEPSGPRPNFIDASLGFRAFGRQFTYHQDLFNELRSYALDIGPSVAATVEYYPGAHFSRGPASWFGVTGSFDYAFGLSSQDSMNRSFATTSWGFTAGLRARVPINQHDIGLILTYGMQGFTVGIPMDRTDIGVPPVEYQFLRVGPSVRVALHERVALLLGASYLGVLSVGPIGTMQYFPRARAGGVDATLGVAISVIGGLEFRLVFEGRRYFYGMHPEPADQWVAGGALDHYYAGTLAIAFRR